MGDLVCASRIDYLSWLAFFFFLSYSRFRIFCAIFMFFAEK